MDFLMGIKGPDFVVLCADTSAINQILTIKESEDKLVPVSSHKIIGLSGESGDRVYFSQYIISNSKLYELRNGIELSTKALANFTRNELAINLRKSPYFTNLLIAGFSEKDGAELYWLDYLSTLHKTKYSGTGYGSYFALSLFDRFWRKDLSEDEAILLMENAIHEVKKRLIISHNAFLIKIIDKNGIRTVKTVR